MTDSDWCDRAWALLAERAAWKRERELVYALLAEHGDNPCDPTLQVRYDRVVAEYDRLETTVDDLLATAPEPKGQTDG